MKEKHAEGAMSAETYHACMSMLTRMSWPEAATLANFASPWN
jgi:hypothetical protein